MIGAVIFDLDGVLAESDRYHFSAWQQTCEKWGIPFSAATGDLIRGVSRLDGFRRRKKQLLCSASRNNDRGGSASRCDAAAAADA